MDTFGENELVELRVSDDVALTELVSEAVYDEEEDSIADCDAEDELLIDCAELTVGGSLLVAAAVEDTDIERVPLTVAVFVTVGVAL